MQTINNKRKYKIQQLFKMLSLSLGHMPEVVWYGPCQRWSVGSQPQTLTTIGFISGRVLASSILVYVLLYGAVVAMETAQLALNPYQAFQTQSISN